MKRRMLVRGAMWASRKALRQSDRVKMWAGYWSVAPSDNARWNAVHGASKALEKAVKAEEAAGWAFRRLQRNPNKIRDDLTIAAEGAWHKALDAIDRARQTYNRIKGDDES